MLPTVSFRRAATLSAFLICTVAGVIQGQNVVQNGGFEQSFFTQNDLWDGVDADGYLCATKASLDAIAESGTVRPISLPVSVTAGDLNGDGLIDIMMADPNGYIYAYVNSGTKTEPKFDHAEIVPVYLSYPKTPERKSPRINLFDWSKRGVLDLAVGNYMGEIFYLENVGSASKPDFRQPADLDKAAVPTSKDGGFWGNLFSPVAADMNNDGRVDLMVGEGSYSANSIHLLLNKGTNNRPAFDATGRSYLAYGDGREHLTPTLADCNGDGLNDLLVADRSGEVGIYLNPGPLWKPGTDFKFKEDVTFGSSKSLGGLTTIYAADMNGDGLFDLLIGKTNGRVALALNRGPKENPQFGPPNEIKGTDLWGKNVRNPSNWTVESGIEKGNAYANVSLVTAEEDPLAQPPEGKSCLRIRYDPSPNQLFKIPSLIVPGDPLGEAPWRTNPRLVPTNTFIFSQKGKTVPIGSTYTFSMKVKGSGNSSAQWSVWWEAEAKPSADKIVRGERNTAKIESNYVQEAKKEVGPMSPGAAWTTITKTIKFEKFANKDLGELKVANVEIYFRTTLTPNTGVLYVDDIQLTPVKTGN